MVKLLIFLYLKKLFLKDGPLGIFIKKIILKNKFKVIDACTL